MNEPAFPKESTLYGPTGMSLRDYFAAKAMEAMLGWVGGMAMPPDVVAVHLKQIPGAAYEAADAMLAARGAK